MSTTWVFVGLLCGRELAMATMLGNGKLKVVFPLIGKDFLKMITGLLAPVGIVIIIPLCINTQTDFNVKRVVAILSLQSFNIKFI